MEKPYDSYGRRFWERFIYFYNLFKGKELTVRPKKQTRSVLTV